jgi:hypothetical protein
MNILSKIKSIFSFIFILLCIIIVGLLLIYGAEWVISIFLPIAYIIVFPIFLLGVFVFLPLSIIVKTRTVGVVALLISSYIFGFILWSTSAIIAYNAWGLTGLFIGVGLLGFGVTPIAIIATIINGIWKPAALLLILALFTFGFRLYSFYIADR